MEVNERKIYTLKSVLDRVLNKGGKKRRAREKRASSEMSDNE
jgi:hypothetical protein